MSEVISLDAATIEAIAQRLAQLLRSSPAPRVETWMTREQAAAHLTVSPRSFDRLRELHVDALKPSSDKPLRWDRNALDVFKLSRGVVKARPGRKRTILS